MLIVDIFLLGRKLRQSPRLFFGLIAVGALAASAIFFASVMLEDGAEEEQRLVVTGMPGSQLGDEIYISSLELIDDQSKAQAEKALVQQVLHRLAFVRRAAAPDEANP